MKNKAKYTTISMPIQLHKKLEKLIKNTGFNSVSAFINHVARDLVASGNLKEDNLTENEVQKIRKRLKALGYL